MSLELLIQREIRIMYKLIDIISVLNIFLKTNMKVPSFFIQ